MSSHPLDALKPVAGRALETALNRAVALDPETRTSLRSLNGQRISLSVEAPALALQITVDGERLRVGPVDAEHEPDLAVRSTLSGLLGQLSGIFAATSSQSSAPAGRVKISGDAELARRLQKLATGFDPDWQQPFVAVFGQIIGVQIANAVRDALQQAKKMSGDLARNAAEYVTEETGDVVPHAELDAFYDDVDVLRDDVERLEARIRHLQGRW